MQGIEPRAGGREASMPLCYAAPMARLVICPKKLLPVLLSRERKTLGCWISSLPFHLLIGDLNKRM